MGNFLSVSDYLIDNIYLPPEEIRISQTSFMLCPIGFMERFIEELNKELSTRYKDLGIIEMESSVDMRTQDFVIRFVYESTDKKKAAHRQGGPERPELM